MVHGHYSGDRALTMEEVIRFYRAQPEPVTRTAYKVEIWIMPGEALQHLFPWNIRPRCGPWYFLQAHWCDQWSDIERYIDMTMHHYTFSHLRRTLFIEMWIGTQDPETGRFDWEPNDLR